MVNSNLWRLASEMEKKLETPATNSSCAVIKVKSRAHLAIFKDLDIELAADLECCCVFIVLPDDNGIDANIVDFYQINHNPNDRLGSRDGTRLISSHGRNRFRSSNYMRLSLLDDITFEPDDILCTIPEGV